MPPASGAGDAAGATAGPAGPADPVLAAERDHLRRSREFLRLMREDVLGLEAMAGDRVHIGRRHIHDRDGHPVVIDWRAPVSRPFYRASAAEPMGLVRRRRFGFAGAELTAYEDEEFTRLGGPAGPVPVSRILIEE